MNPDGTEYTTVMIALAVPNPERYALDPANPENANLPEVTPAAELHLTLAFLGEASEMTDEQIDAIRDACRAVAAQEDPPSALFPASVGVFPAKDGDRTAPLWLQPQPTDPFVALRDAVLAHLNARGVGQFVDTTHPVFNPHVTLAYIPTGSSLPSGVPTPIPVEFDTLVLAVASVWEEFPLGSTSADEPLFLTASVEAALSEISASSPGYSVDLLRAVYLRQRPARTPLASRSDQALEAVRRYASPDATTASASSPAGTRPPRVSQLVNRAGIEPDPVRRTMIYSRALALVAAADPKVDARANAGLAATLRALIADGNSSLARSMRARRQLRDRKGRWIEMGGGVRFKVRSPGAGSRWFHGTVAGIDAANGKVAVKLDDKAPEGYANKTISVSNSELDQPKAIIGWKPKSEGKAAPAAPIERPWSPERPVLTGMTSMPWDKAIPTNGATWKDLDTWLEDRPKIAFDTETTGLDVEGNDQVVQLAATRVNPDGSTDSFETKVNPGRAIDPAAAAVHGISDDDVKDAPSPEEAYKAFMDWATPKSAPGQPPSGKMPVLVAHNANFDVSALHAMRGTRDDHQGDGIGQFPVLDTFRLARATIPKKADGGPVSGHSLGALSDHFGIELGDNAHRADADAAAAAALLPEIVGYAVDNERPTDAINRLVNKEADFAKKWPAYRADLADYRQKVADSEAGPAAMTDPNAPDAEAGTIAALERIHAEVSAKHPEAKISGGNIANLVNDPNLKAAEEAAPDTDEFTFTASRNPIKDQPVTLQKADIESVRGMLSDLTESNLPDGFSGLSEAKQKAARSGAAGKAYSRVAAMFNERNDDPELRSAPAVKLSEADIVPDDAPLTTTAPGVTDQELRDAAVDSLAEMKKRIPGRSPNAKLRDRIDASLSTAVERFENGTDDREAFLSNLDQIKVFADHQADSASSAPNPELDALGAFAEDLDDIHQADGDRETTADPEAPLPKAEQPVPPPLRPVQAAMKTAGIPPELSAAYVKAASENDAEGRRAAADAITSSPEWASFKDRALKSFYANFHTPQDKANLDASKRLNDEFDSIPAAPAAPEAPAEPATPTPTPEAPEPQEDVPGLLVEQNTGPLGEGETAISGVKVAPLPSSPGTDVVSFDFRRGSGYEAHQDIAVEDGYKVHVNDTGDVVVEWPDGRGQKIPTDGAAKMLPDAVDEATDGYDLVYEHSSDAVDPSADPFVSPSADAPAPPDGPDEPDAPEPESGEPESQDPIEVATALRNDLVDAMGDAFEGAYGGPPDEPEGATPWIGTTKASEKVLDHLEAWDSLPEDADSLRGYAAKLQTSSAEMRELMAEDDFFLEDETGLADTLNKGIDDFGASVLDAADAADAVDEPEAPEVPGEPEEYFEEYSPTPEIQAAWESRDELVGALGDVFADAPVEGEPGSDARAPGDAVLSAVADLSDEIDTWETLPEDPDSLNEYANRVDALTEALAITTEDDDFFQELDDPEAALQSITDAGYGFAESVRAAAGAEDIEVEEEAPDAADAAQAFLDVYDEFEALRQGAGAVSAPLASIGNAVANIGAELERGDLSGPEAGKLLDGLVNEIDGLYADEEFADLLDQTELGDDLDDMRDRVASLAQSAAAGELGGTTAPAAEETDPETALDDALAMAQVDLQFTEDTPPKSPSTKKTLKGWNALVDGIGEDTTPEQLQAQLDKLVGQLRTDAPNKNKKLLTYEDMEEAIDSFQESGQTLVDVLALGDEIDETPTPEPEPEPVPTPEPEPAPEVTPETETEGDELEAVRSEISALAEERNNSGQEAQPLYDVLWSDEPVTPQALFDALNSLPVSDDDLEAIDGLQDRLRALGATDSPAEQAPAASSPEDTIANALIEVTGYGEDEISGLDVGGLAALAWGNESLMDAAKDWQTGGDGRATVSEDEPGGEDSVGAAIAKVIESELRPLPKDTILWRGLSSEDSDRYKAVLDMVEKSEGVLKGTSHFSTSRNEGSAGQFADGGMQHEPAEGIPSIVLRINAKAGQPSFDLDYHTPESFGDAYGVTEVVLPAGTDLRITSVEDYDGITNGYLVNVDPVPADSMPDDVPEAPLPEPEAAPAPGNEVQEVASDFFGLSTFDGEELDDATVRDMSPQELSDLADELHAESIKPGAFDDQPSDVRAETLQQYADFKQAANELAGVTGEPEAPAAPVSDDEYDSLMSTALGYADLFADDDPGWSANDVPAIDALDRALEGTISREELAGSFMEASDALEDLLVEGNATEDVAEAADWFRETAEELSPGATSADAPSDFRGQTPVIQETIGDLIQSDNPVVQSAMDSLSETLADDDGDDPVDAAAAVSDFLSWVASSDENDQAIKAELNDAATELADAVDPQSEKSVLSKFDQLFDDAQTTLENDPAAADALQNMVTTGSDDDFAEYGDWLTGFLYGGLPDNFIEQFNDWALNKGLTDEQYTPSTPAPGTAAPALSREDSQFLEDMMGTETWDEYQGMLPENQRETLDEFLATRLAAYGGDREQAADDIDGLANWAGSQDYEDLATDLGNLVEHLRVTAGDDKPDEAPTAAPALSKTDRDFLEDMITPDVWEAYQDTLPGPNETPEEFLARHLEEAGGDRIKASENIHALGGWQGEPWDSELNGDLGNLGDHLYNTANSGDEGYKYEDEPLAPDVFPTATPSPESYQYVKDYAAMFIDQEPWDDYQDELPAGTGKTLDEYIDEVMIEAGGDKEIAGNIVNDLASWHDSQGRDELENSLATLAEFIQTGTADDVPDQPEDEPLAPDVFPSDTSAGPSLPIGKVLIDPDVLGPLDLSDDVIEAISSEDKYSEEIDALKADNNALFGYAADYSNAINTALREGDFDWDIPVEEIIDDLDKMMAASVVSEPTTVWRAITGPISNEWMPAYINADVGDYLIDKGFLSTTMDKEVMSLNMDSLTAPPPTWDGKEQASVIFEIDVPAGTNALDVNGLLQEYFTTGESPVPGESELLLDRGARLRITGKKTSDNGRAIMLNAVVEKADHTQSEEPGNGQQAPVTEEADAPVPSVEAPVADTGDGGAEGVEAAPEAPDAEALISSFGNPVQTGSTTFDADKIGVKDFEPIGRYVSDGNTGEAWDFYNSTFEYAGEAMHTLVNERLRQGKYGVSSTKNKLLDYAPGVDKLIDGMDSVFESSVLTEDTTLYRQVTTSEYSSLFKQLEDAEPGDVLWDPAYVSTSKNDGLFVTAAQSALDFGDAFEDDGVVFEDMYGFSPEAAVGISYELSAAAGLKAVDIEGALEYSDGANGTTFEDEEEVLLARGTGILIESAVYDSDTKAWTVKGSIIQEGVNSGAELEDAEESEQEDQQKQPAGGSDEGGSAPDNSGDGGGASAPEAEEVATPPVNAPVAGNLGDLADYEPTVHDVDSWEKIGGQLGGGSTGGTYRDADGNSYYVKIPLSDAHVANEVLHSMLERDLGVNAATVEPGMYNGEKVIVSRWVPGNEGADGSGAGLLADKLAEGDEDFIQKAYEGFTVDAWLANWDAVGPLQNNIVVGKDADGNDVPYRIDGGGAMLFSGFGNEKGSKFGPKVTELESMRMPSMSAGKLFAGMTDEQVKEDSARLATLAPDRLRKLIELSGHDQETSDYLFDVLSARQADLLSQTGAVAPSDPAMPIVMEAIDKYEADKAEIKASAPNIEAADAIAAAELGTEPAELHIGADGIKMALGDRVVSVTDGKAGKVISLAANGKYAKVLMDDQLGAEKPKYAFRFPHTLKQADSTPEASEADAPAAEEVPGGFALIPRNEIKVGMLTPEGDKVARIMKGQEGFIRLKMERPDGSSYISTGAADKPFASPLIEGDPEVPAPEPDDTGELVYKPTTAMHVVPGMVNPGGHKVVATANAGSMMVPAKDQKIKITFEAPDGHQYSVTWKRYSTVGDFAWQPQESTPDAAPDTTSDDLPVDNAPEPVEVASSAAVPDGVPGTEGLVFKQVTANNMVPGMVNKKGQVLIAKTPIVLPNGKPGWAAMLRNPDKTITTLEWKKYSGVGAWAIPPEAPPTAAPGSEPDLGPDAPGSGTDDAPASSAPLLSKNGHNFKEGDTAWVATGTSFDENTGMSITEYAEMTIGTDDQGIGIVVATDKATGKQVVVTNDGNILSPEAHAKYQEIIGSAKLAAVQEAMKAEIADAPQTSTPGTFDNEWSIMPYGYQTPPPGSKILFRLANATPDVPGLLLVQQPSGNLYAYSPNGDKSPAYSTIDKYQKNPNWTEYTFGQTVQGNWTPSINPSGNTSVLDALDDIADEFVGYYDPVTESDIGGIIQEAVLAAKGAGDNMDPDDGLALLVDTVNHLGSMQDENGIAPHPVAIAGAQKALNGVYAELLPELYDPPSTSDWENMSYKPMQAIGTKAAPASDPAGQYAGQAGINHPANDFAYTDQGSVLGAYGQPLFPGTLVKATTDGKIGQVTSISKDGKSVKVSFQGESKISTRSPSKLEYDPGTLNEGYDQSAPNAEPNPAIPGGVPLAPNSIPTPYTPSRVVAGEPDPTSPWFGEENKPTPPQPLSLEGMNGLSAEWVAEAEAFLQKKKSVPGIDKSYGYARIQAAANGSKQALSFLLTKGDISLEMYNKARAEQDENKARVLKIMEDYSAAREQYARDLNEWNAANGIAGISLKGFDAPSVQKLNEQQADALMQAKYKPVKLTEFQRDGIKAQKGGGWQNSLRRTLKRASLNPENISPDIRDIVNGLDQAVQATPPLAEDIVMVRTLTEGAFVLPGVHHSEMVNFDTFSKVQGTIQTDWGFPEMSPGSLEAGSQPGFNQGIVWVDFLMPAGTRGAWTGGGGFGFKSERGFIAERGLSYYIHKVERRSDLKGSKGQERWYVQAEVLPKMADYGGGYYYDLFGQGESFDPVIKTPNGLIEGGIAPIPGELPSAAPAVPAAPEAPF